MPQLKSILLLSAATLGLRAQSVSLSAESFIWSADYLQYPQSPVAADIFRSDHQDSARNLVFCKNHPIEVAAHEVAEHYAKI